MHSKDQGQMGSVYFNFKEIDVYVKNLQINCQKKSDLIKCMWL